MDLIKCFCGVCETWFQRKYVKEALKANVNELLREKELRQILQKYLEHLERSQGLKPVMSKIIKCYELCEAILDCEEDFEENREDLEDFCFNEDWEDKLGAAIDDGTTTEFLEELVEV